MSVKQGRCGPNGLPRSLDHVVQLCLILFEKFAIKFFEVEIMAIN